MRTAPKSDLRKFRKYLKSGMPGPHAYVVLLGMHQFDWPGVLAQIDKGLPFSAIERFLGNSGLTQPQLLDLIGIAPRTFMRRKKEGHLSPAESDRLIRAARVYAKVLHLFSGDTDQSTAWLTEAQRAFRGTTPLEMARTEIGAQEVERLVFQLEHGVLP
jgi:putative toxin-antitoxin system antitoxin component (TIGR02293 family)